MNIGSIILAFLGVLSVFTSGLFSMQGDVVGTVVFLASVPLFFHMAYTEAK